MGREGIKQYYQDKIEACELIIHEKTQDLRRLEAQRNALNAKVRLLREELQLLQEPGSYVGEVVKLMGKKKVLVKVHPEGKYVVDIASDIDIAQLTPTVRVALRNDSYTLHKVLPNKVDPLVSLMMVEKVPDSTYEMVGGLDKQIKEIKEVIELPVKHPELFESLGIAQPKGVLLYGPPGTGKTLLARAVAHHTDCKFIRVSGSELVQKYIGEGSRMVRELFVMAREHAPSIIFMDEIDSIGSSRIESGGGGGDSEVQRTMLELLNQLDGFEATKNIKVIMATNRIDILDPALLRPGRIDRKIEFPPPNEIARADILRIHSRKMNLTRGIDLRKIAEKMTGSSGAEVKGVCTEAGMYALRERRVHVTQEDFEMAVAKVMKKDSDANTSLKKLWKCCLGIASQTLSHNIRPVAKRTLATAVSPNVTATSPIPPTSECWIRKLDTNEPVGIINLSNKVFAAPIRKDILHRVVVWQRDGLRQGTQSAKTRAEVSGTTRKAAPQKGRGGVAFAPKPRDHTTQLQRKVQDLGLRIALSAKYAQNQLLVVDDMSLPTSKTKDLVNRLLQNEMLRDSSVLFLTSEENVNLELASRNVHRIGMLEALDTNVLSLLQYDYLVLDKESVNMLELALAKE
ncbi:26S protease regulatory subunit 8 [Bifiguratus adelaidae]|uniref:26S proteasome regulatory subunit 8 homolog n=1 Tax=Bifiguratus adelaidae TaxID=1938954 RepID=A0A261XVF4_9FUNG|nr:26S protease regulatory subunit 8 [Bifiguratus adelaidae]